MNSPTPIVVANLKAHKTWDEMSIWLEKVVPKISLFQGTVVVCPSAPFLAASYSKLKTQNSKLQLGSQDVSKFEEGPYTGEFAASQITQICPYAIIGHSERRRYFGETDEDVIKKLKLLLANKITPILCISDFAQLDSYLKEDELIISNAQKIIFVHEPPNAISGDKEYRPQALDVANVAAGKITQKIGQKVTTIYGGSINPENVASLFSAENLDGGLIGQASIDPQTFIKIIQNVS